MNYLFENAPWIVVGTSKESYISGDLERRLEDIEREKEAKNRDVRVESL
jgi:hypothetical protein